MNNMTETLSLWSLVCHSRATVCERNLIDQATAKPSNSSLRITANLSFCLISAVLVVTSGTILYGETAQSESANLALTPGLWTSHAEMMVNSLSLPSLDDDNCVTAKEAKDPKKYIESHLRANGCKLKSWFINVRPPSAKVPESYFLTVGVECLNDQGSGKGQLKGTISKTDYALSGVIQGEHDLLGEIDFDLKYSGRRAKECPSK